MDQPLTLSDELIYDARATSEGSGRSVAGQIELWAKLGRSIELLLRDDRIAAALGDANRQSISSIISAVDSAEGQTKVREHLSTRPFSHFESVKGHSELLCRIDADGTRTVGRFVNRVFVAES